MKILVTGANGLIGKKIVKQLVSNNKHEVFATSLKKMQLEGAQTFTSNLQNADINNLIEQLKLDAVIHCAALSSPDACEVDRFVCKKMNIEVTSRIASACRDYSTYLAFLSTDFIFDGIKGDYTEEDAINPISYYGESKMQSEEMLKTLGIPHAVIRTSLVYGYEEKLSRPNILTRVVQYLGKQQKYRVPTDQIRTPTLAEDLAKGVITVTENKINGLYHIAGDTKISVADFATTIAKTFNLEESLLQKVTTRELSEPAPRPLNSSLIIDKARKDLNYNPTPLAEGIAIVKSQMNL
ncbi:MAG: NAD(P)-dependent oxidoreductase [Bacteroidales bacterium]|nr:NAD(P)-dependent oxidoreductase [Bacteroidales bacterium]